MFRNYEFDFESTDKVNYGSILYNVWRFYNYDLPKSDILKICEANSKKLCLEYVNNQFEAGKLRTEREPLDFCKELLDELSIARRLDYELEDAPQNSIEVDEGQELHKISSNDACNKMTALCVINPDVIDCYYEGKMNGWQIKRGKNYTVDLEQIKINKTYIPNDNVILVTSEKCMESVCDITSNISWINKIALSDYYAFLWFENTPKEIRKQTLLAVIEYYDDRFYIYSYNVDKLGENYKAFNVKVKDIHHNRNQRNLRRDILELFEISSDEKDVKIVVLKTFPDNVKSFDKEKFDYIEIDEKWNDWIIDGLSKDEKMLDKIECASKVRITDPTPEDFRNLLDSCYEKCLNGIPKVSPSVEEMANEYMRKYEILEDACNAMTKNQVRKCATSGFLTGFGGLITLPVSIPANLGSVIYVQMRMIACTAYLAGYDLKMEETRTFIYACLAGISLNQVLKNVGITLGEKLTLNMIKTIPGKVILEINEKIGFRFMTQFGSKGLLKFGKFVPGVGAIIGGSLDYMETKLIAKRAYKWFFESDFSSEESDNIKESESEEVK